MARIEPGTNLIMDIGPGGVEFRPLASRFIKVFNDRDKAVFVPDSSVEERSSSYNRVNNAVGVRGYKGQYVVGNNLYRNVVAIGTGPCWYGTNEGVYNTPAAAPEDFTEVGVYNANAVNPNDYKNDGVVKSGTSAVHLAWQFYQAVAYGCPATATAKISVRQCYI